MYNLTKRVSIRSGAFAMKKKFVCLLLTSLLLFCGAAAAYAREVITDFASTVRISADSSLLVTEEITFNVENVSIRHGINRKFPTEYRDKDGNRVRVGFKVHKALLDGREISWQTGEDGDYVNVRIGDADKYIPTGFHKFTIVYTTTSQLGFFEDHDELYWNVTGNEWAFPVKKVSCRVSLPGRGFGQGFNSVEWYVGAYGEKGQKSDAAEDADRTVTTTRELAAGEGLTVVYTWPKGLVTPTPPPAQDNEKAQGAVGAAVLAAVLGWLLFAWNRWGRDPARTVIPLFHAPNGESPGFMRFARDLQTDRIAFTAAVLGLAVKGALRIEEQAGAKILFIKTKGKYVLHRVKTDVPGLQPEEDWLMKQLFPGAEDSLSVDDENANILRGAMTGLRMRFEGRRKELYTTNGLLMLPAVLIYFLGVGALYPFSGEFPLNMAVCGTVGALVIMIAATLKSKSANTGGQNARQFAARLLPPLACAMIGSSIVYSGGGHPFTVLLFMAAAAAFSVMRPLMASRTKSGSELLAGAEGLALYMETAEKNRLEMLNPPEETPELFEKLLPYALALDTAKTWGNRFADVLGKAQYKPNWYAGPDPFIFMTMGGFDGFATGLTGSMNSSLTPHQTLAPGSSSGFGGGGFSGGGGGGGGGSGW